MIIMLSTTQKRATVLTSASKTVVIGLHLSKDDVENLIEDLVRFMNYRFETESVFKKFGEL